MLNKFPLVEISISLNLLQSKDGKWKDVTGREYKQIGKPSKNGVTEEIKQFVADPTAVSDDIASGLHKWAKTNDGVGAASCNTDGNELEFSADDLYLFTSKLLNPGADKAILYLGRFVPVEESQSPRKRASSEGKEKRKESSSSSSKNSKNSPKNKSKKRKSSKRARSR